MRRPNEAVSLTAALSKGISEAKLASIEAFRPDTKVQTSVASHPAMRTRMFLAMPPVAGLSSNNKGRSEVEGNRRRRGEERTDDREKRKGLAAVFYNGRRARVCEAG